MSPRKRNVKIADNAVAGVAAATRRKPAQLTSLVARLATLGMYLCALAWPLGAYQRVLGPLHLHHIALAPILFSALMELQRDKRLRAPFELWWPCAVVAVLGGALRVAGYDGIPWRVPILCGVFVAVIHLARNRETILRALQCSVAGGGIMMLLSVLARLRIVYPTAYSLDSGLLMAGPYTVRGGLTAGLVCLALLPPLVAARRNSEYAPGRIGVIAWFLLPAATCVYFLLPPRPDLVALQPAHNMFLFPAAALLVPTLWLVARMAAKLWLARKFMAPGVYRWFIATLLAGVFLVLLLAPVPSVGLVFLGALVVGYGQPYVVKATPVRQPVAVAVAATAALLVVNMMFVLPGDPRDYEQRAQTALARGDLDAMRAHLDFVKRIAPNEARADYYLARAWLAEDKLAAAAQAFGRSLHDLPTRLLPPPDASLVADFLNELRDRSSALPEQLRGVAYEQALIAAGRDSHALSLLELRGESGQYPDMNVWPLATALATALDAPGLVDTFLDWDAGVLAAILESAGPHNAVVAAPLGFPEGLLPLTAMAQIGPECDFVQVISPAGKAGGARMNNARKPAFTDAAMRLSNPGWRDWRRDADGQWRLAFGMAAVIRIDNAPEVLFNPYPTQLDEHVEGLWEITVFVPAKGGA